MTTSAHFVLVGHCGPDNSMLRSAVRRAVPGAEVTLAGDDETVRRAIDRGHVLLINRVLDGDFEDGSGFALLERIMTMPAADRPAAALISDLEPWQSKAQALGAPAGFGKSRVFTEETAEKLRALADAALAE